jgi:hypothetical protein
VKANFVHKAENDEGTIKKLFALFDYPSGLEKETFDFVDINILMLIAEIQIKYQEYRSLNKLSEILKNQKGIISRSDSSQMFPVIFSNVALFLVRNKQYLEAIEVAESGIRFSKEFNNMGSLAHLHYIKSHSLLKLGRTLEYEIEASKCIAAAIVKDNTEEKRVFYREIEFDHKINPIDLLKRHQDSVNAKIAD